MSRPFAGHKKVGSSLLTNWEKRFVGKHVDRIPAGIETYHLTLLTIVWSGGVLLFSYLATYNIQFLWLVSLMVVFQYFTDLFDGAVGRHRNTGLIKWGFYMDHYLDYVFLSCILIGYSFIIYDPYKILFFLFLTSGAFMVNAFLSFSATNEFRIYYMGLGPTEVRLGIVILNALIVIFGKTYLAWSLPYALVFSIVMLNMVVYKTQKQLWEIDMQTKKKEESG